MCGCVLTLSTPRLIRGGRHCQKKQAWRKGGIIENGGGVWYTARMRMKQSIIASPMNYVGGKYKLLEQILPLFPDNIGTFVDLFCGGCNVGINVNAQKIIFNDNLSFLIDLYEQFKTKSEEEIIRHIENRIEQFSLSMTNKDGFLQLRQMYNTEKNPLDLFVLSAFSFNHQIRFNNAHEFNNPFGKERSSFNERMKSNLLQFVARLHETDAIFCARNFDEFDFSFLSVDDFVYADPPYLISTGTYNDGKRGFTGWNEEQEKKLLQILDALDKRKIRFALSNVIEHKGKENVFLKEWIAEKKYCVSYLEKDYANASYHTIDRNPASTVEVLVTNYEVKRAQENLLFA